MLNLLTQIKGLKSVKNHLVAVVLVVGLTLSGSHFTQVVAQNSLPAGLTVSPITSKFVIAPGETTSIAITVINRSAQAVTLWPKVLDFTTDNEKGQPTFIVNNDGGISYALASWVRFNQGEIVLAINEQRVIEAVIKAPSDAEPGGHYGAVLFSTEKPAAVLGNTTKVQVIGYVGTLLLATVPGAVTERLAVEQFDAPKFVFGSPVKLDLLFKNTGNVHVNPSGEIVIRNWSGNQTAVINVNNDKGDVLPEKRRRFSQNWVFPLATLGKYKATAQLTYGTPPQELTVTKQIIILPYWLILAVILVVAGIIYGITRLNGRRLTASGKNPILY